MSDMIDYAIRKCERADLEAIRQMQAQWFGEDITYGFTPESTDYLSDKLGKYFLVAERDGQIIGFVHGEVHRAKDMAIFDDQQAYIEVDDLYVSPSCRNEGVGGMLLSTILREARENGIEKSCVYSASKDMDQIIGFYRKHGFKTWYVQMFQ